MNKEEPLLLFPYFWNLLNWNQSKLVPITELNNKKTHLHSQAKSCDFLLEIDVSHLRCLNFPANPVLVEM